MPLTRRKLLQSAAALPVAAAAASAPMRALAGAVAPAGNSFVMPDEMAKAALETMRDVISFPSVAGGWSSSAQMTCLGIFDDSSEGNLIYRADEPAFQAGKVVKH
jgi:hypothetical protein